ncbi:zinc finger-interacting factor 1 [Striga asiatica]|uniref:Zinc finger-interacting factor 1 n=1 Tax=Striga asiatica TaxID=4170 RepID=A0A5A7PYL9_STRAF|nr:zinc finger-interacting factor 1 [Striga asiatica]
MGFSRWDLRRREWRRVIKKVRRPPFLVEVDERETREKGFEGGSDGLAFGLPLYKGKSSYLFPFLFKHAISYLGLEDLNYALYVEKIEEKNRDLEVDYVTLFEQNI